MAHVELTQFMRPDGRPVPVSTEVPDDVAELARGMVLTCEVLMSGQIVIYGRMADWDEEDELMAFASNEPGPRQPDIVTANLIKRVADHPKGGN